MNSAFCVAPCRTLPRYQIRTNPICLSPVARHRMKRRDNILKRRDHILKRRDNILKNSFEQNAHYKTPSNETFLK
jgi:hypothetical protein